jgi:hypothetical protein
MALEIDLLKQEVPKRRQNNFSATKPSSRKAAKKKHGSGWRKKKEVNGRKHSNPI